MKYNFTDSVRKMLAGARVHASRRGHESVGTEHILLALLDTADPVVDSLLSVRGARPADLIGMVEACMAPAGREATDVYQLPYTAGAKKALEGAMAAARRHRGQAVGLDHILFGLLGARNSAAAAVLDQAGVTAENILAPRPPVGAPTDAAPGEATRRMLSLELDDASDRSIYEQIVEQIQERVATGRLQPGERLPPVRRLADALDIAPGTVARAYSELERLGLVVTQGARGTRVAERERSALPDAQRAETLAGLLRPVAVAAFHLGATAAEMRQALDTAMKGIFKGKAGARKEAE